MLVRLKRESLRLSGELISISNSSDPYPRLDQKSKLTRKCLEILSKKNCTLQIITKSDLITRDVDILKSARSMVSLTVLSQDDDLSKKIEPNAPVSSRRIKALKTLVRANIPTSVRVDPVIPYLNDDLESLIETVANLGVLHITSSTYKVKLDNWKRFSKKFPDAAKKLKPLYFDKGDRIGNSFYLPKSSKFTLMKKKKLTEDYNLKFGCCREGFDLNSATCDGSWLLKEI